MKKDQWYETRYMPMNYKLRATAIAILILFMGYLEARPTRIVEALAQDIGRTKEPPLIRTLKILGIERPDVNLEAIELRPKNNGALKIVNNMHRSFSINLSKYHNIASRIFDFEDSIVYENIELIGSDEINEKDSSSRKAEKDICMKFIRAFRNLKAIRVSIKNIWVKKEDQLLGIFAELTNNRMKFRANIKKIVFHNVSNCLAIQVLKHYVFDIPVELVFSGNKYITWNFLSNLPKHGKYKRIEIEQIDGIENLSRNKIKKLREIIPVLKIQTLPPVSNVNEIPPELEGIFEGVIETTNSNTVRRYKNLAINRAALLQENKIIELLAYSSDDFIIDGQNNSYIGQQSNTAADPSFDAEMQELLKDNPYTSLRREMHFNHTRSEYVYEVTIRFETPVKLTVAFLKQIFYWFEKYIPICTKITIKNVTMTKALGDALGSVKIYVMFLQHLKYAAIEEINGEKLKLELRNVDLYHNASGLTKTSYSNHELSTKVFPAELYIKNNLQCKERGPNNTPSTIKMVYPGAQSNDAVTLCMVCGISAFINEESKEVCKTTIDNLSIKEVENITWEEFCSKDNRQYIEKHLHLAYFMNSDITITKENLFSHIKCFLTKPIVILPECMHTICAKCFSNWHMHMQSTESLVHERNNLVTISCPTCRGENRIATFFQYPVRTFNEADTPKAHIYQSECLQFGKKSIRNYVFYVCDGFKNDDYYREVIGYLIKKDVVIRSPVVSSS
ncbi:hypothetical protein NEPAR04_0966 [Nematocida parisii]|nr:hypothetical protein NEPAR08_0795 [Nematocida parisii]KAI5127305.1 hypothetical protein NEPAR03_0909 [Nematocida parisii]KAI5141413.1 hypothetical protein NEPAR04_0966 [Nematocida parisii]